MARFTLAIAAASCATASAFTVRLPLLPALQRAIPRASRAVLLIGSATRETDVDALTL